MTTDTAPPSAATPDMRQNVLCLADTSVVFDCVQARGPEGIGFDVWYSNVHGPALAREYSNPRARRYASPSRSSYVIIGELLEGRLGRAAGGGESSLPAMVQHHERFVGQPLGRHRRRDVDPGVIDAAVVYTAFLRAPSDRFQELGRWYEEEHLPMLLACPQWVMTRRFLVTRACGLDWTHMALHYLTDLRALESPQRDAARDTPWRDKLKAEGWFSPEYRVCYRTQDF